MGHKVKAGFHLALIVGYITVAAAVVSYAKESHGAKASVAGGAIANESGKKK